MDYFSLEKKQSQPTTIYSLFPCITVLYLMMHFRPEACVAQSETNVLNHTFGCASPLATLCDNSEAIYCRCRLALLLFWHHPAETPCVSLSPGKLYIIFCLPGKLSLLWICPNATSTLSPIYWISLHRGTWCWMRLALLYLNDGCLNALQQSLTEQASWSTLEYGRCTKLHPRCKKCK